MMARALWRTEFMRTFQVWIEFGPGEMGNCSGRPAQMALIKVGTTEKVAAGAADKLAAAVFEA
jgi:hypothetical protein